LIAVADAAEVAANGCCSYILIEIFIVYSHGRVRRWSDDDSTASSAVVQRFSRSGESGAVVQSWRRGNVSYLTAPTVEYDGGADMHTAILPCCNSRKRLATSAVEPSGGGLGGCQRLLNPK